MAVTTICSNATSNGFKPDANGVSAPSASCGLVVSGPFGTAKVIPWISDGTNPWIELPEQIAGHVAQRLVMGPDWKFRLEIREANALTSINATLD